MSIDALDDVIDPREVLRLEEELRTHGFTECEDLGHGQFQYYPETEPHEETYMVWIGNAMNPGGDGPIPSAPEVPIDQQYEIHLVDAQSGETANGWRGRGKKLKNWRNFIRQLKIHSVYVGT